MTKGNSDLQGKIQKREKKSFAELKNNEIQHLENTSVNLKTAFQK